jgi:hypothetical protein
MRTLAELLASNADLAGVFYGIDHIERARELLDEL